MKDVTSCVFLMKCIRQGLTDLKMVRNLNLQVFARPDQLVGLFTCLSPRKQKYIQVFLHD